LVLITNGSFAFEDRSLTASIANGRRGSFQGYSGSFQGYSSRASGVFLSKWTAMMACVIADHYLRQRGQVGDNPAWPFAPPAR
jgi:hypothetical protein